MTKIGVLRTIPLIAFASSCLFARPPAPAHAATRWWVAPALGGGWVEAGGGGFAGAFTISMQASFLVLSGRAAGCSGDIIDGGGMGDVGVLLGIGREESRYHLSISAGAGVGGADLGSWSVPLEVQLFKPIDDSFGIGIALFAALTEGDNFAGVGLTVPLGNLR